ncbi:MAG: DUF2959 family protein [Planctomycetota bacterium]
MRNLLLPALLVSTTIACQNAYYATMEKFGVDKREILVDRVASAREGQEEAKVQIQSTFEAFQELTGFQGGDLEAMYKKLKGEYEDAEDAASEVTDRIEKIEHVAGALFSEWETEASEMNDPGMRRQSEQMMRDTQKRYEDVVRVMHNAEDKMQPVLVKFKDHVTLLKHNLNAAAIAGLKDNALTIESDVADLIRSMQASIEEADAFLKDMKPAE